MVSVGVAEITVSITNADSDAAKDAVSVIRRFYPGTEIELVGSNVRLCGSKMTKGQLRTIWLCHLLEAKTRDQTVRAREAILGKLFN